MSKEVSTHREKFKAIQSLLDEEYLLAHVDTKGKGVTIPDHLRGGPTVTLKLSRLFRGNLEITDESITAELLFNGSYFTCVLPLGAIWGVTSAKGSNLVWPDSAPEEVLEMLVQSASKSRSLKSTSKGEVPPRSGKSERSGHLKRVK